MVNTQFLSGPVNSVHSSTMLSESREPLLSIAPFWLNWHQVWLTVPSICSGSQGRERWLHHTASTQQLPDLPCCIWVWRWGFLFFFPLSLLCAVSFITHCVNVQLPRELLSSVSSELWLSLQAAAGWMLWSWHSAAPVSTSWQPKPGERQTSARLPSLPISSTCCRPVRSMTPIFYSKQPTQPRASQTNSICFASPCWSLIINKILPNETLWLKSLIVHQRQLTTLNNTNIVSVLFNVISPHSRIWFGFLKIKELGTCIPTSNIMMP